ncbi:hypothetical protein MSAN_00460700 [Mycena sanguinolenta]|uniref:T6SS Phospholipase effector Tle1-like catalytic domain-containing protein n=1 Tax=Mycena sanguinolenta TaxID=230812 RepID=A0A8H6ZE35_9AGAR|nr:hypothetical protein MSAN_00460700 [Mycena sanguinolenta]
MTSDFIPERPKDAKYRTLIVLLDGTGDRADKDATNIVLLHDMLRNGKKYPGDNNEQLVYYREGIGADTETDYWGFARDAYSMLRKTIDQAVATSFKNPIIEAYTWLAGMLKATGLSDTALAEKAFNLYKESASLPSGTTEQERRKTEFAALEERWQNFRTKYKVRRPSVKLLGCWDSVNSVGFWNNISLAYTATNDIVHTFRHAIALDERRAKFKQNMWSKPKPAETDGPSVINDQGAKKPAVTANAEPKRDNGPSVETDVQEVWFAGCHCDVGGGSVLNGTRPNLAHISLRWMIRECFKADTGIVFSSIELEKLGIQPSHLYPHVRARPKVSAVTPGSLTIQAIEAPGWWPKWSKSSTSETPKELDSPNMSEEALDARDALAPIYDQLALKSWMWQAMESLYTKKSVYDAATQTFSDVWHRHNGAGRTIPPAKETHGGKIKVHRTVQMRMKGTYENGGKYIPKARVGWGDFEKKTPFEQAEADIEWVS